MNTLEPNVTHELAGDLRALAEEAGTLIQDVATGKPTAEAVATLKAQFEVAQARFSELCGDAKQELARVGNEADEAVRENPYRAIAVIGAVGLLAGFLLGRVSRH